MLSNFVRDALVVIVVLGFMIFIHELGHFVAAKLFGVRVLTFSLGFGARLFGYKRRFSFGSLHEADPEAAAQATDYRVSVLPFGGYVKMAGDDPSQPTRNLPDEFLSKPRWQRFVIAVMGPSMNILLALVLLAGLYRYHYSKPAYEDQPARVGHVDTDSPAAKAGVQPGDLIVRFDGLQDPKWAELGDKVLISVGDNIPVDVLRGSRTLHLSIAPRAEGPDSLGYAGFHPVMLGVIETVERGFPASVAGVQPGDQVVGLNGKPLYYWPGLALGLRAGHGEPVDLTLRRAGKDFQVHIKPYQTELMGEKLWRIGVSFHNDVVVEKLPWPQALVASVRGNFHNTVNTFDVLAKILTRRMSARSLTGPIGIAQLSGEMYRAGITDLLTLVSFISLQLAIFNLLPIPILDGGMILLLAIESLLRRDLSLGFKERFAQVGIAFLLLLAVFVMYNDIVKTFRPY
jgi:regulator of sigma E protease